MFQTATDLQSIAERWNRASETLTRHVIVCAGTGCVANGALALHARFQEALAEAGLPVRATLRAESEVEDAAPGVSVTRSGCQGFCQMGPLVTVEPDGILYVRVRPEDIPEIVETTLKGGEVVQRLLYVNPLTGESCRGASEIPFYARQQRFVLEACGRIDPGDIGEYIARGGYQEAWKACFSWTPADLCREILDSGLRGRGGGGFPTGRKWDLARQQGGRKKYVICNGDEGDPGAFMDRCLMEGNPHAVLEGLMIAGRAIGADEAFVYVRAEYPLAVARIRQAVADAESLGILGESAFRIGPPFRIHVMEGAGAFVCGEETALIASIEGERGMPRPKPPFPAQSGLWGRPTVINNVETLATVPLILQIGSRRYREKGTGKSPGTKTFALTGHVNNTGLIEVPLGTTLREVVHEIGGGVIDDDGNPSLHGFKAVQIGGPSGGCLTPAHLDLPLDFDSLQAAGAMVGSGGLVVMNDRTCMVQIARFFMQFTQHESCGKCVLCREGTKQMLALLDDIIAGNGGAETLVLLEDLATAVQKASLCGLGKTAPNPVLSTLRHFREEYEAHVLAKRCPAKRCTALLDFAVDPALCRGCGVCIRKCPVNAITGEKKQLHHIDAATCIRCGACADACKFGAISRN